MKFKVHTQGNIQAKFGLKIQSGSWFYMGAKKAPPLANGPQKYPARDRVNAS